MWAGWPMIRNSISGKGGIRAYLQSIQTGCGTLPPLCSMGCIPPPGSEADRLHSSSAEIKNTWRCTSVFLVSHSRCVSKELKMQGFSFIIQFYCSWFQTCGSGYRAGSGEQRPTVLLFNKAGTCPATVLYPSSGRSQEFKKKKIQSQYWKTSIFVPSFFHVPLTLRRLMSYIYMYIYTYILYIWSTHSWCF